MTVKNKKISDLYRDLKVAFFIIYWFYIKRPVFWLSWKIDIFIKWEKIGGRVVSLVGMGKMLTPRNVVLGVIGANMICRPLITLSNRQLPEETRRYTAIREFCTELFGLFNTLTFTTAIEYLGPRLISKDATRKVIGKIKGADWNKLSPRDQRLKAAILVSSLIGTILSTAILTPLLNNMVLNRLLERIMGKKTSGQAEPAYSGSLQPGNNPLFDTFTHNRRLTGAET